MNMSENDKDKNLGDIVIYQTDDGETQIDVKFEDETVWLTQQQMAVLFQTSRPNIVEYIKHIYEEGELEEGATCRNFRQVRTEGKRHCDASYGAWSNEKSTWFKKNIFMEEVYFERR